MSIDEHTKKLNEMEKDLHSKELKNVSTPPESRIDVIWGAIYPKPFSRLLRIKLKIVKFIDWISKRIGDKNV